MENKEKKDKKKADKKVFSNGDIIICIEPKSKKLTQDAMDFLSTYKYFKIIDVNENFNIDISYFTQDGKQFYFNPNRFELRDKTKSIDWAVDKDGVYVKITEEEWKKREADKKIEMQRKDIDKRERERKDRDGDEDDD